MFETLQYDNAVTKMRQFFKEEKGFTEVPTQSRLSILAACEDPKTIGEFIWDGDNWPLPQTGQMWLEYELLNKPELEGVFCVSTSYRNEPDPVPGRHLKMFPMFEFESHGDFTDMLIMEEELLDFLGFERPYEASYDNICEQYGISIIESDDEERMANDFSNVLSLKYFPQRSQPFWNMNKNPINPEVSNKCDVILYGQETIGSAERSCDPDSMRKGFLEISDGEYSNLLFDKFSKKRVMKELDEYLNHDFFPRFGGGIGVSRMARAIKLNKEGKNG